jgi:hypothetical protein
MKTYSLFSFDGEQAMIDALPVKYPMELNRSDMTVFIRALREASMNGDDRSVGLYTAIAETLGVELV